jgi:alpha/beta superfamily hydrolase
MTRRRIESLRIAGPAGALEAQLLIPHTPRRGAALLCHPHPQHGGTMHTKALHHAARGLASAGIPVLRFQFRGVGCSAGRYTGGPGERADARAALEWLAARHSGEPLVAGGFSFGSWVALTVGLERDDVHALVALGPPVGLYDFSFVRGDRPLLCAAGDRDAFAPPERLRDFARALGPKCELVLFENAEHLLATHTAAVEAAVHEFAARILPA